MASHANLTASILLVILVFASVSYSQTRLLSVPRYLLQRQFMRRSTRRPFRSLGSSFNFGSSLGLRSSLGSSLGLGSSFGSSLGGRSFSSVDQFPIDPIDTFPFADPDPMLMQPEPSVVPQQPLMFFGGGDSIDPPDNIGLFGSGLYGNTDHIAIRPGTPITPFNRDLLADADSISFLPG